MLKKLARAILVREMHQLERRVAQMPRSRDGQLIMNEYQIEAFKRDYLHVYKMYRAMGGTDTAPDINVSRVS